MLCRLDFFAYSCIVYIACIPRRRRSLFRVSGAFNASELFANHASAFGFQYSDRTEFRRIYNFVSSDLKCHYVRSVRVELSSHSDDDKSGLVSLLSGVNSPRAMRLYCNLPNLARSGEKFCRNWIRPDLPEMAGYRTSRSRGRNPVHPEFSHCCAAQINVLLTLLFFKDSHSEFNKCFVGLFDISWIVVSLFFC